MDDRFRLRERISPEYRQPIVRGLLWQALPMILAMLMLDGGRIARYCGIMMVAYWLSVTWIVIRRPLSPTYGDLQWIGWAFVPLFGLGVLAGMLLP